MSEKDSWKTVEDKLGDIAHLWSKLQCAFCLNPHATNQVTIENKKAPTGSTLHDDGKAVAHLCDGCKGREPKFATQVIENKNVNLVDINNLEDISEDAEIKTEDQKSDDTARKIVSEIDEKKQDRPLFQADAASPFKSRNSVS